MHWPVTRLSNFCHEPSMAYPIDRSWPIKLIKKWNRVLYIQQFTPAFFEKIEPFEVFTIFAPPKFLKNFNVSSQDSRRSFRNWYCFTFLFIRFFSNLLIDFLNIFGSNPITTCGENLGVELKSFVEKNLYHSSNLRTRRWNCQLKLNVPLFQFELKAAGFPLLDVSVVSNASYNQL